MSELRVPVVGPSWQIPLVSASPAAPDSAIDASTPTNSAKVQTHSAKTACFQHFSPNGSAVWRPHPSTRVPAATKRGNDAIQSSDTPATRRQRASHGAKPPPPPMCGAPEGPEDQAAAPEGGGGPGCGTRGRRQGLAGHRDNAPSDAPATQAPPVWRVPEGPEGTGGLRDRPLRAVRLACGDLAGGRARRRPEHQRRHKQQHAACAARGRAAAHGGIKQPGLTKHMRRPEHQGYRTFRVAGVSPRCCGRGWRGGVHSSKLRRPSRG